MLTYLGWGYGGFFDGPEMSIELGINAIVAFLTRAPIPPLGLLLLQQLILKGQAAFPLWLWYLEATAPLQLVGEWIQELKKAAFTFFLVFFPKFQSLISRNNTFSPSLPQFHQCTSHN